MLTLVSKDSVKISDHFDVLCVLIACMVLEIINQMSKNKKSSLIVWNTVRITYNKFGVIEGCLNLPEVLKNEATIALPRHDGENPKKHFFALCLGAHCCASLR